MATITFCDPFGKAAFPTVEIPDSVFEVLEDADFSINSVSILWDNYCVEIENHTDAGGDMIHTLHVPKDDVSQPNAWYKAFYDVYNDFDAFEEAVNWYENMEKTPFSCGSDLYEDIHAYELDVLSPTTDKLFDLAFPKHGGKENTMAVSYEDALDAAYTHWVEFYDERDRFDAEKADRSRDWREARRHELSSLASASCAVTQMLCDMFGLSEERVHDDLVAKRAEITDSRG